ncbi:MAG: hypothetical protein ACP5VN_02225, partial [Acidobacteriota bacterium]
SLGQHAENRCPKRSWTAMLTYLRLAGVSRGLLLNFHAEVLRAGLRRVVLKYRPDDEPIRTSASQRLSGEESASE